MDKLIMLTKAVRFPFSESERVRMIQRTYNNTWTMLIYTFKKSPVEIK